MAIDEVAELLRLGWDSLLRAASGVWRGDRMARVLARRNTGRTTPCSSRTSEIAATDRDQPNGVTTK